jgi:hypothetical protein
MKYHPSEMERVTEASVTAVLRSAGVRFASVWTFSAGVVRVDVVAWPGRRLAVAGERVAAAFDDRRWSDFWVVRPAVATYRWRPWRSAVTVRDPGLEWTDETTGLTYLGTEP